MSDFYNKLVDLYAARELTEELELEMEQYAAGDPALSRNMKTLRETVDRLVAESPPEFTDESYQRILMKVYARGVEIQTIAPEPSHMQYHLPMQG